LTANGGVDRIARVRNEGHWSSWVGQKRNSAMKTQYLDRPVSRFAHVGLVLALGACADGVDHVHGVAGSGISAGGAGGATGPTAAAALIAPFGTGTVTGTATFTQSGTDVTVNVSLSNCPDGIHSVHIHHGTSCTDAMTQGAHWDTARGEGIPDVVCSAGTGTSTHTRNATDPALAWSIGGAPTSNVIGHVFVVHDPGDPAPRIGCGQITAR
jgi:Cu/Zn superoxide dismutase